MEWPRLWLDNLEQSKLPQPAYYSYLNFEEDYGEELDYGEEDYGVEDFEEEDFEEDESVPFQIKSTSGESLGSGLMEWPRFFVSKKPIKQSEPGTNAATNLWMRGKIRDHNKKLMTGLAPVSTKHVEIAVLPILEAAARALQEKQKHLGTLLELEGRKLALKMRLNRRCVGRSQSRRRRASSLSKLLRPRTRQLRHPQRLPWNH